MNSNPSRQTNDYWTFLANSPGSSVYYIILTFTCVQSTKDPVLCSVFALFVERSALGVVVLVSRWVDIGLLAIIRSGDENWMAGAFLRSPLKAKFGMQMMLILMTYGFDPSKLL